MNDLLKLLAGTPDEVRNGITGKSHDDLLKLRAAEQDGQNREAVLYLLEGAIAAMDVQRAGGVVQMTAVHSTVAADFDRSGPADITPASDFSPSGAPRQVTEIDVDHAAVDNDPRSDTTAHMNRIDFNDPIRPGHEIVTEQLQAQSKV